MREIKAGDTVFVNNWGSKFPMFEEWFVRQMVDNSEEFDIRWAVRFAYGVTGMVSTNKNEPYKVLYVSGDKALITELNCEVNGPIYLIGTYGLRQFRRMTKSEIEKALGYEIEIIGE